MPSVVVTGALAGTTALIGYGMLVAPGAKIGVRLSGVLLGVVMSFFVWRSTQVGVVCLPQGIRLRLWRSSMFLAWDEIERFEVGSGSNALQPTYTLHVLLKDGRDIAVQPVSASAIAKRTTHVHDAVGYLNAEKSRTT